MKDLGCNNVDQTCIFASNQVKVPHLAHRCYIKATFEDNLFLLP